MVTSKRTRLVERPVALVERSTWEPLKLSERQVRFGEGGGAGGDYVGKYNTAVIGIYSRSLRGKFLAS